MPRTRIPDATGNVVLYQFLSKDRNPTHLARNIVRVLTSFPREPHTFFNNQETTAELRTTTAKRQRSGDLEDPDTNQSSRKRLRVEQERAVRITVLAIKGNNQGTMQSHIPSTKGRTRPTRYPDMTKATVSAQFNTGDPPKFLSATNELKAEFNKIATNRAPFKKKEPFEWAGAYTSFLESGRGGPGQNSLKLTLRFDRITAIDGFLRDMEVPIPSRSTPSTTWVARAAASSILTGRKRTELLQLYFVDGVEERALKLQLEVEISYAPRGEVHCPLQNTVLSFVFDDQPPMELSCFECPICGERECVTTVQRLLSHLRRNHSNFKSTLEESEPRAVEGDARRRARFVCELDETRRDSLMNDQVVRLSTPLGKVNGKGQSPSGLQSIGASTAPSTTTETSRRPFSSASTSVEPFEINPPKKRKRKIECPRAPEGVTFFNARSKRRYVEGELLSESDSDDADAKWLFTKDDHRIDKDGTVPLEARPLVKKWNRHFYDENPKGHIYFRAAFLRFAKTFGPWIKRKGLLSWFKKLATELLENERISEETYNSSMEMVKQSTAAPRPSPERTPAENTPAEQTPAQIPYGRCLCGDAPLMHDVKPIIHCNQDFCKRDTFHVACVMKHWDLTEAPNRGTWVCKDCKMADV